MTITRSASVSVARRLGIELTRSIKSRLAIDPKCFDESNDFYGDPGDAPEWSMSDNPVPFPKVLWRLPGGRFTETPIVHNHGQWELIDSDRGLYQSTGKPFITEPHLFTINPSTGLWHMEDIEF